MSRVVRRRGTPDTRLYREDCRKGLRRITAGSVDLVFADPPFNIGQPYADFNDQAMGDA